MNKANEIQVLFLPWLTIRHEIAIGITRFWPYEALKRDKLLDTSVIDFLDKYFSCHRGFDGKPVKDVTICTYGKPDLRCLAESEEQEARSATNVLAFDAITSALVGYSPQSGVMYADGFELVSQHLLLSEKKLVIRIPVFERHVSFEDASFPKPFASAKAALSLNDVLLKAFDRILALPGKTEARERVLRALEWFRMAWMYEAHASPQAQIVMIATAFETVLGVQSRRDKGMAIAEGLETYIVCQDQSHFVSEEQPVSKKKRTLSKLAWWGRDLYRLRNRIVHGEEVRFEDLHHSVDGQPVGDCRSVAAIVMRDLVIRYIYSSKLLGKNSFRPLTDILLSSQFDRAYGELGWIEHSHATPVHARGRSRPRPSK